MMSSNNQKNGNTDTSVNKTSDNNSKSTPPITIISNVTPSNASQKPGTQPTTSAPPVSTTSPSNGKNQHPEDVIFLSEIVGAKVYHHDNKIGRLTDFLIVDHEKYAECTHVFVTRPFGNPSLLIPSEMIKSITSREVVVELKEPEEKYVWNETKTALFLRDYILDKKVLDIEGKEVEVVYDVELVMRNNKLLVTAVDISGYRRLKRMGMNWLADRLHTNEEELEQSHSIAWLYIQPLSPTLDRFSGELRLKILKESLSDLRPVDIAGILEELEHEQRLVIFNQLEPGKASDTLEEIEPNAQRDLIASLDKEKVAHLIDQMTPGQAADVLSSLPWWEIKAILPHLKPENVVKIKAILEAHEQKILNYATSNYIKASPDMAVEQAQIEYPWRAKNKDVIMYIYVTEHDDKLLGVIDIKELLRADHKSLLRDIMVDNLICLSPDSTLKEATTKFARYDFRALPVVDERRKIVGVVPYRDIMNLTHHFIE